MKINQNFLGGRREGGREVKPKTFCVASMDTSIFWNSTDCLDSGLSYSIYVRIMTRVRVNI